MTEQTPRFLQKHPKVRRFVQIASLTGLAVLGGCSSSALAADKSGPAPTASVGATATTGATPGEGTPLPTFTGPSTINVKDYPIQKGQCQEYQVSGNQAVIVQLDGTVNNQQIYDTGPGSETTASEAVLQNGDYTVCATQGDGDIQVAEDEQSLEAKLGQDSLGAVRRDKRIAYILYFSGGTMATTFPTNK